MVLTRHDDSHIYKLVAETVRDFLILGQFFLADSHFWKHDRSLAQSTGEDAYFIHEHEVDPESTVDDDEYSPQDSDAEYRVADNAEFFPGYFSD